MTRIIGGAAGGRRLGTPPGTATRPTSDRVREALFSAIEAGFGALEDSRVLDLYAGSGALGLEALSRGALHATLVESDRRTASLITRNAKSLGLDGARVVAAKAEVFATSPPPEPYDLILLDPPYAVDAGAVHGVVARVTTHQWWASDGWIVVERSARDRGFSWPSTVDPYREKKYGETALWYGRSHA